MTSNLSYRQVSPERTGWRDEALSNRHRSYGFQVPAIDLDFVLLEYDTGICKSLIEYKNEYAKPQYPSHPSYQALIKLGTDAGVPVFAVRYKSDFSDWKVVALNELATIQLGCKTKHMNEIIFVQFLYKLRGRKISEQEIINLINGEEL